MKIKLIVLFIAISIYGCKKAFDTHQPAFTAEQLEWIQNIENPKYRVIMQKEPTIVIDTIITSAITEVYEIKGSGDLYLPGNNYYFSGYYTLKFANFHQFNAGLSVAINNVSVNFFNVSIFNGDPRTKVTDTASINGVVYDKVYKLVSNWSNRNTGVVFKEKVYFKKGLGFIYFSKDSIGSTDSVKYEAFYIP